MINFIKRLFGLATAPAVAQEETKAVVTTTTQTQYIPPAKPINKVKAISDAGSDAIKAAHAPKPANKKRRPYRGNKVKPAVTEGNTKGGNNTVKPAQVAKAKPAKPKAPVAKNK